MTTSLRRRSATLIMLLVAAVAAPASAQISVMAGASADANLKKSQAARVIDGDLSTAWISHAPNAGEYASIYVELAKTESLSRVELAPVTSNNKNQFFDGANVYLGPSSIADLALDEASVSALSSESFTLSGYPATFVADVSVDAQVIRVFGRNGTKLGLVEITAYADSGEPPEPPEPPSDSEGFSVVWQDGRNVAGALSRLIGTVSIAGLVAIAAVLSVLSFKDSASA